MARSIDKLIINYPHEAPKHYWLYDREIRDSHIRDSRLPTGCVIATFNSRTFDDFIKVYLDYINVPNRFGSGYTFDTTISFELA